VGERAAAPPGAACLAKDAAASLAASAGDGGGGIPGSAAPADPAKTDADGLSVERPGRPVVAAPAGGVGGLGGEDGPPAAPEAPPPPPSRAGLKTTESRSISSRMGPSPSPVGVEVSGGCSGIIVLFVAHDAMPCREDQATKHAGVAPKGRAGARAGISRSGEPTPHNIFSWSLFSKRARPDPPGKRRKNTKKNKKQYNKKISPSKRRVQHELAI